jgi:hypothetical protein
MVAEHHRRCPQEHGWVAQRAAAGHGGPGSADAGRAFVTLRCPQPASGVQCPVRADSVHACPSTRPLSGVRCRRLSVQVSGVRCPAWASGVRGFPRPLCPTGVWSGGWRWGRQPDGWDGWDGRGRRGRPPVSTTGSSSSAQVGTWRPRPAQAVLGPAEASAWTWPSSWEVVGSGEVDRVAEQDRPDGCEDRSLVGEPVRREVATTLRGHRGRLRAGSPGRCEPPGWTATWPCGRAAAASCSERRPLDAGDALTCEVGGGGEGI